MGLIISNFRCRVGKTFGSSQVELKRLKVPKASQNIHTSNRTAVHMRSELLSKIMEQQSDHASLPMLNAGRRIGPCVTLFDALDTLHASHVKNEIENDIKHLK